MTAATKQVVTTTHLTVPLRGVYVYVAGGPDGPELRFETVNPVALAEILTDALDALLPRTDAK